MYNSKYWANTMINLNLKRQIVVSFQIECLGVCIFFCAIGKKKGLCHQPQIACQKRLLMIRTVHHLKKTCPSSLQGSLMASLATPSRSVEVLLDWLNTVDKATDVLSASPSETASGTLFFFFGSRPLCG